MASVTVPDIPPEHVARHPYNDYGNVALLRKLLPYAADVYAIINCDEDPISIRLERASVEMQFLHTSIRPEGRLFIRWDPSIRRLGIR